MRKPLFQRCFKKSIWIYHTNTGACNGCDIEAIDALTPYYDAERFGLKLVATPRYADALLVSGPMTRPVVSAFKRLYESVPDPKLVIAIGSCAIGGGIWYDSYNVVGGVDNIVPVDFFIPGCPPKPEAILHGIGVAVGLTGKKIAPVVMKEEPPEKWLKK